MEIECRTSFSWNLKREWNSGFWDIVVSFFVKDTTIVVIICDMVIYL
jgi:hypothetical protein